MSFVSTDNSASQAIGGFKESPTTFRKYHCLGSDTNISTMVR